MNTIAGYEKTNNKEDTAYRCSGPLKNCILSGSDPVEVLCQGREHQGKRDQVKW